MAYKRPIADVITAYDSGTYDNILSLYSILVDESAPDYNLTDTCLDDIFVNPHTLNAGTCTSVWTDATVVIDAYTEYELVLAYELFGYEYEFYKSSCDDNGHCACDDRCLDGKNVMSKRKYGVLTNNGYLDNNYSREYVMQLKYNEANDILYISDEHSKVHPPYNSSLLDLNPSYYRKKLIMTYVGFDIDNGKFIEQIIFDGDHESDGIWEYDLTSLPCHHGDSDCNETEIYTDITVVVEYVNDLGFNFQTEVTYPLLYQRLINIVDGKVKLDGVYKTYYYDIPYLTEMMSAMPGTSTFMKGSIFYFQYIDEDGNLVEEYRQTTSDIIVDYTTYTNVIVSGGVQYYDLTNITDKRNFVLRYFSEVSAIDYLKNIGTFRNVVNPAGSTVIEGYMAEDAHLITYQLRDAIIDSINNCEVPCEKFSFDTWVALKQKKMAAGVAFCNNNLQETARIMSTVDQRCKNCD